MQDILKILGTNVRSFRKTLGWTQEKLAEQVGISVPFMTQIELGHKSASLEVVAKIANALGVCYDTLFYSNINQQNNKKFLLYNIQISEKTISDDIKKVISENFSKLKGEIINMES